MSYFRMKRIIPIRFSSFYRNFSKPSEVSDVRVRYAPSPTGYLHLGGLRTALFNYLFAKSQGGRFIIRIEDTDKKRQVEGSIESLISSLHWCGIHEDEGPTSGGLLGPYIQSERTDVYKKYANELIDSGHAYRCFCSSDRLKSLREAQKSRGMATMYDKACLGLSTSDINQRLENGVPYTVRLKVQEGRTTFKDMIKGYVQFSHNTIDDQVLLKSDGYPTYHLANVVDDHLMKISHVIRGEEWLTSTAKHLMLYKALGFTPPKFAHLGLLLNHDHSKLSKRQGDVAVEDFIEKGYLPSALVNFVSLLGWNPSDGDTQEIFTMEELKQKFSIENVNKAGSIVNKDRLDWMNSKHLRSIFTEYPKKDVINMIKPSLDKYLTKEGQENLIKSNDEYLWDIMNLMKERVNSIDDFGHLCHYFFEEPQRKDENIKEKIWEIQTEEILHHLWNSFNELSEKDFTSENIMKEIHSCKKIFNVKLKSILMPLRYCTTGMEVGAGLGHTLQLIGKNRALSRLSNHFE